MQPASASYLPSVWNDDLRMDSMFSVFRTREVNPSDWDGKFRFWKQALNDWCRVTNRLTFTFLDARSAFVRNGRLPRCFSTVEEHMSKQNNIVKLDQYMKMCSGQGWISWSWDMLVKKPVSYAWSFLSKFVSYPPENNDNFYINLDLIKEKSAAIIERHQSLVENGNEDSTIALKVLSKHCKDICKSEKDLELCCLWLQKEKKLSLFKNSGHTIVKFSDSESKSPTELSQIERAVIQLRMVKKTLERQIETFDNEILRYTNEAKAHLKEGSRTMAKSALQKKKQAENMLQKKEKTLENIDTLLSRLQDANTQKSVLEALQAGSVAFKLDQKMDLDKVDETMAAVQEVLDIQNEIEDAVAFSVAPADSHDVSELEKELQDILASGDQFENEKANNDDELMERLNTLRYGVQVSKLPSPSKETSESNFKRLKTAYGSEL